ncbi:MAG: imidazoleglycerol-phosphate dehydratase [Planctomycetaceae bacterium]|nr:MAG: imidazoleglycerol-phosphate dehydratase [Planctomycetaceae bacterium]
MKRQATIRRETSETRIELFLDLDGQGQSQIDTGIGFFDHMLTLWSRHGLFDLQVEASGDLHVDQHHTVEDVGICLGLALTQAVGDKRGIVRYGSITLPMDETLVTVAVDLSGRSKHVYQVTQPQAKIGQFDAELLEEFWSAFASNAGMNLHQILHYGRNGHHIAEAVFKATARALRQAVSIDPRETGLPTTKGWLGS